MPEITEFHAENSCGERFFALSSSPGKNFAASAEELVGRYAEAAKNTFPVLLRFHLSDVANQAKLLQSFLQRYGLPRAAMVGQAPLSGAKMALEAWHFTRPLKQSRISIFSSEFSGVAGSGKQMRSEFNALAKKLGSREAVARDTARTWIYCRDIDNHYADLATARREFFTAIGLTEKTHYIASTGIEGKSEEPSRLVRMDSLLMPGLAPEQTIYMHAPEHLSPTHIYGVTFERGTRIVHGDRSHFFLSGTASIDKNGRILHENDVIGQTRRMIENVEALLASQNAKLADLKQAVVYLRDTADRDAVERILMRELGNGCAFLMLHASVCRPGWLLEMDGIAVNSDGDRRFPDLN